MTSTSHWIPVTEQGGALCTVGGTRFPLGGTTARSAVTNDRVTVAPPPKPLPPTEVGSVIEFELHGHRRVARREADRPDYPWHCTDSATYSDAQIQTRGFTVLRVGLGTPTT